MIGDAGWIRQILPNLAGNAEKFTERGHVPIEPLPRPAATGSRLRVALTDIGPGMPQEVRGALFFRFSLA